MTSKKVETGAKVITGIRDVDFVSVASFEVNDEKLSVMKVLQMPLHVISHVKSLKIHTMPSAPAAHELLITRRVELRWGNVAGWTLNAELCTTGGCG